MIVERGDDIKILFSHEFFHIYHGTKISWPTSDKMVDRIWFEGFATYVSGLLNPTANDAEILMDVPLSQACGDDKLAKQMALDFLPVMNSLKSSDYEDWFTLSGQTKPARRGYCLGLRVVRRIAQKFSIQEMAAWDEVRFSKEISLVLLSTD